jgi:hypothetical protein
VSNHATIEPPSAPALPPAIGKPDDVVAVLRAIQTSGALRWLLTAMPLAAAAWLGLVEQYIDAVMHRIGADGAGMAVSRTDLLPRAALWGILISVAVAAVLASFAQGRTAEQRRWVGAAVGGGILILSAMSGTAGIAGGPVLIAFAVVLMLSAPAGAAIRRVRGPMRAKKEAVTATWRAIALEGLVLLAWLTSLAPAIVAHQSRATEVALRAGREPASLIYNLPFRRGEVVFLHGDFASAIHLQAGEAYPATLLGHADGRVQMLLRAAGRGVFDAPSSEVAFTSG